MVSKFRTTACCSMMSALSIVLLLAGSLIPGATYSAPILGMLPLIPVLSEFGARPALSVYTVTAVLALLLIPDKEISGIFAVLGYYPVLRPVLNRIRWIALRVLLKIAVCTLSTAILYTALFFLVQPGMLSAEFSGYSWGALTGLLLCGNMVFLLLDQALARLTVLWHDKMRRLLFSGR